ncbi:MAG: bifunctional precorrin-2 dehydrogenase/sirohydrochlorin ferrochelatase [Lachnospiraceae bacterium]|nr:bifunctional precorrin-2 dehydrogenase/sirohydrochlorin ferrochelatase [Lachnospiraceae bacterium]
MSYFPFFIDLQGQQGLIVGGGTVAFRKVQALLEFGVQLTVVSLEFSKALQELADEQGQAEITLQKRTFQESDLDGQLFVIAATSDEELNHRIAQLCRERQILVNVVDQKKDCSFYFPALVKREEIVIGISSGGRSPALSRRLRQKAETLIPDYYQDLNNQLGRLRERVLEDIAEEDSRKRCLEELLQEGERRQGIIPEETAEQIICHYRRAT